MQRAGKCRKQDSGHCSVVEFEVLAADFELMALLTLPEISELACKHNEFVKENTEVAFNNFKEEFKMGSVEDTTMTHKN